MGKPGRLIMVSLYSKLLGFFRRNPKVVPVVLLAPILTALAVYLYALLSLGRISFYEFAAGVWGQTLTLENYLKFFTEPLYLRYMGTTLRLSGMCAVSSLVLGYPVAYFLARLKSPRMRGLILLVIILPNFTNIVIRMLGWNILLRESGVINYVLIQLGIIEESMLLMYTELAVVLAMMHYTLPFVILSLMGYLQGIDPTLEQAAQNLGAGKWQTFIKIILPLSIPGLVVTSLLAYVNSVNAFIIPLMMGGGRVNFMSNLIYSRIIMVGNVPLGAAASVILLLTSFTIMFIIDTIIMRKIKVH